MENCTKFNDLEAHLRELFKSASYSESTVKDMDFILRAFTNYMNANGMEEYSPEIGEILIHYCRETLKVCDSRVSRAKVIVGKLNRLYQGLDGEEALWADKIVPVELPDSLSRALDSFISHCRHKGNKETTLHYKRWIYEAKRSHNPLSKKFGNAWMSKLAKYKRRTDSIRIFAARLSSLLGKDWSISTLSV